MDWNLLFDLVMGAMYARFGYLFFVTARRRVEYRTGHELHPALALLWALTWPVWMIIWSVAVFILPAKQRPVSLLHEPSKADRAAAGMDRRRAERKLAVADWERRAEHWYDLGEKAEAEGNQALKWLVADNLTFLLDAHPEGPVKVDEKALKTTKGVALDPSTEAAPVGSVNPKTTPSVDWQEVQASITRKAKAIHGLPSHRLSEGDDRSSVGFCNICARYDSRDRLIMEGVCVECAQQQGIH